MDAFKIDSIPPTSDGIRILHLSGPFTLQGVFDFNSIFRKSEDPITLIDLTDVPYMDSAALGAIVGVHTSSQRHRRRYALVGVSDRLRTLFDVVGVGEVLVTYPTLEEAQKKFAPQAASN
jgi:anti-anti-sigma factor